ncbi:MAG: oxidoreductase, partial [Rhodobacterales bacterium 12-65-15]
KAFIDSFSVALRHELQDKGVSVTVLMPGATETEFFERAGMTDTKVGQSPKADPADVAKAGFKAMMDGDEHVVPGLGNKLTVAMSGVLPKGFQAEQHRRMAEPEDD